MLSSIVLLLVLQVFWLRSAYHDAADNFRKETNLLFRNTIFAMHDSLIQRNLQPVAGDSMMTFTKPSKRVLVKDAFPFDGKIGRDTTFSYLNAGDRTTRVEIIMSAEGNEDSLQRILRPLMGRMRLDKQPKNFIFRFGPDSLQVDSISFYYEEALSRAGIDVPFTILARKNERGKRMGGISTPGKGIFVSETVDLNPINRYAVSFPDVDGLLLREITPQILFSIFLTLLTIGSFYIMFKNLRDQQRLMQIKNDFISNITHELKTPVATVSVALEALKNFHALENPQRTSEYLEIAQNELNRLTLMTDKILKTAVFEDKGVELKIERTDLDQLVQQVLSSLKLVFEKRGVRLAYKKDGSDFNGALSHAHITNVIYNLLDNALKYSTDGSPIEVSLHDNRDEILLSVKDNGIGIAAEYQKKIFEKFFRVPSGDVHNIKGYGLGLSYVASVVSSHHGKISLESEPGKGSCFTITLPKQHED